MMYGASAANIRMDSGIKKLKQLVNNPKPENTAENVNEDERKE